MIERATGMVRSAPPAGAQPERHEQHQQGDDHERGVERRSGAGVAVGVGVVGGARHGGGEHEQDGRGEGDVGGCGLPGDVEDDRQQERPDRDVGDRRMDGVPEPGAVQDVLDRPDRAEQGAQPAMVEVTEWTRPAVLRSDQPGEQTTQFATLPGKCIHRPSTSSRSSGITSGHRAATSWTSPLWPHGPRPYISSCPKGQVEPPDWFEE